MNSAVHEANHYEELSFDSAPFRVTVDQVISSRYGLGSGRPSDWDKRQAGIDTIRTSEGKVIRLLSDGGQSTPAKGWVLMVTGGEPQSGYKWTLYGMPRAK